MEILIFENFQKSYKIFRNFIFREIIFDIPWSEKLSQKTPEMNRSQRVDMVTYFYFFLTPNSREVIDFWKFSKIPPFFLGKLTFPLFLAPTWPEPVSCWDTLLPTRGTGNSPRIAASGAVSVVLLLRKPPFIRKPPLFVPDRKQGGAFLIMIHLIVFIYFQKSWQKSR